MLGLEELGPIRDVLAPYGTTVTFKAQRPPEMWSAPRSLAARLSAGPDPQGVCRVCGEGSKILRISGEDGRSAQIVGERSDNGVDRRGDPSTSDRCAQRGGPSGQAFARRPDDAGSQQPVLVKVAAMIAGQRFGEDD